MRSFSFCISLVVFLVASQACANGLDRAGDSKETEALPVEIQPNPVMAELFQADQAIRLEVEKRGGWIAVKDDKAFLEKWEREDLERQRRVTEMLASNALHAGVDFYRAAFIFQHSEKPEAFLEAHHLAIIAIAKGYDARWISAATLDRYLLATGKQQIYGTQYRSDENGVYVRSPVQPDIVSDAERATLNVPALIDQ